MNFLNIDNKTFLVTGVSNKKSVAYFSAKNLLEAGAEIIFTVQSDEHKERVEKLFPDSDIYILDVKNQNSMTELCTVLNEKNVKLSGILHSIAFANLTRPVPFHATSWEDFSEATQISSFSLVELTNALIPILMEDASIVTISISDTKATSYGYMGPIKAMLDATVSYLAKSLSENESTKYNRVNAVCAGPLKTSASAGIPGYIDSYIFAEKLTMRKKALVTAEVADTVTFLLSPRSSGINATGILVDAGMRSNHFDSSVVRGNN
ncbi:enoyl-ACP reductase [Bacteriovorax sp. Seq25_V]|uniref:enoyl-ACP reductase FabI n=1 Tax=Bacteriovorax sp. Seq25_V TaxID=1201288 RepID=UPI00038A3DFB|nr:SDR family oxidoreductase [Bacteriovorax sp. Seq25_V]EQC44913.1 oxidoreductase, short chain dehydrogenase/reductase family protein [Bacteriovorax sp. Seq25_V]